MSSPDQTRPAAFRLDENLACDQCGRFGAFPFDSRPLCPECCASRGSCCAEACHEMPAEDSAAEADRPSRSASEKKNF